MPIGTIAAVVGAGALVGGTVMQMSASKKAAKEAKKANKFERQKAELQSARQKMEAMRAGRLAMAEAQQNASNQGVGDSSSGRGGAASIFSQTSVNLSFLDQYGYYSDQASRHLQKSANAQASASMWGAVAQLGGTVYGMSGGFKGPKPPAPKEG
jgi:ABC-type protease/lipase transport system fused ATPase/permease subunit